MNTKQLKLAIIAAALVMSVQAQATLYQINFDSGYAIATIDVNGLGVADSGTITVNQGPNQGVFGLLAANYGQNVHGDNFAADNLVSPSSTPFLDNNGLQFGGFYEGYALWSDSPTSYELFGYNYNSPVSDYGMPDFKSSATISLVAVPEPATIIAGLLLLLPFGASAFRIIRIRRVQPV